eukprot:CAMPEP_0170630384 /NCGR_PEP_ID=MMETSP0224-20130122/33955_1 /TAXON_ID=285029 /ORGANISM="Togula jolla, Strain CCCM 725" /LENGTH=77 /DNA_ID=CAMNT_0010958405 /DNA_START=126 /DNA_END=359 /DNA_ORIENTATION=-
MKLDFEVGLLPEIVNLPTLPALEGVHEGHAQRKTEQIAKVLPQSYLEVGDFRKLRPVIRSVATRSSTADDWQLQDKE